MKNFVRSLLIILAIAVPTFAQAPPPTNAPQFSVTLNFLGGQPYGQSSALSTAFSTQFTTDNALRADILAMPGAGYTGYIGSDQYNFCGLTAIENLLSTTSLACGKFSPYGNAGIGLGRIQQGTTTIQGIAGLARIGANYDPSGSGKFTLNLFEAGWGHFGPSIVGQKNNGFFFQSGIAVGLGTSTPATTAKTLRMSRANTKKLAKINDTIKKVNNK